MTAKGCDAAGNYTLTLQGPGRFLAWSAQCNGTAIDFAYQNHILEIHTSAAGGLKFIYV